MTTLRKGLSVQDYIDGILTKNLSVLSRAISLIESEKETDQEKADAVLNALIGYEGKSRRLGVTGVPGAGKSTFINELGLELCKSAKVAVLSIDPSSQVSGGSILGDKTRMNELAVHPNAYIRPSPSLGHLGGVAARTRETILLCEAFGFDYVIVESVGVGQSEQELANMVDAFILLALTGSGDELQGIKRGILEAIDFIIIHKADQENLVPSRAYKQELEAALKILRSQKIPLHLVSSLEKTGFDEFLKALDWWLNERLSSGKLEARRTQQKLLWLDKAIEQKILFQFRRDSESQKKIAQIKEQIAAGKAHPLQVLKLL